VLVILLCAIFSVQAQKTVKHTTGKKVVKGKTKAQTAAAKKPAEKRDEAAPLLLGMMFGFPEMTDAPNGEGKIDPVEDDMGTEIAKEMPEIAKEVAPLNGMQKLSLDEKNKRIREVSPVVEAKLTGVDKWQFLAGKTIATIMAEAVKGRTDPDHTVSEEFIRARLAEIKTLVNTAPPNAPESLLSGLKELSDLADREGITSSDNLTGLIERCTAALGL
jgi:hypothetical protein